MLPNEFITYLEDVLQSCVKQRVNILNISAVSGGSINDAYRLQCNTGNYFLKVNDAHHYPKMFEKEAEGLLQLKHSGLHIPEVLNTGEYNNHSFLLMEYMENGKRKNNFFEKMAEGVAILHKKKSDFYGWENDNYIGSLEQKNERADNGAEFFIHQRLQPLVKRAGVLLGNFTLDAFEKLYIRLPELIPDEKTSLLHGDLWSGNYITDENGNPSLIDPAVYYGNREADIAMTKLFGGFDYAFYETYNDVYPLEKGWKERLDLWNLYPLLVHVNLFGQGYVGQVKQILKYYT